MLNLREIDTTVGVYYLDWMDIRIGQWRHKLFSSRAWYLEIVVSSFALHLFCLYLWCFPLLRRCCSIPTNCRWFDVNGPNMGSSSGRFYQASSFASQSMKLPDVLMENVLNESLSWREIQVCRTFISEDLSNVYWIFALSFVFLLKLGLKRNDVHIIS